MNAPVPPSSLQPTAAAADHPSSPTGPAHSLDALWAALQTPPAHRAHHLGEALLARGLVTVPLLARTLDAQAHSRPHRLLGRMLVDAGLVTEASLDSTLAEWLGLVVADLRGLVPEPQALARIPPAVAEREGVLPLMIRDDTLVLAVPDPADKGLLDELRFMADLKVLAVGAVPGTLAPAVARAYHPALRTSAASPAPSGGPPAEGSTSATATDSLQQLAAELTAHAERDDQADPTVVSESDNTLVRLVNRLIADAVRSCR